MAEFDTIAKRLIQTHPADFARFALQRDDIEDVKVIETELPTIRRADSPSAYASAARRRWSTTSFKPPTTRPCPSA